MAHRIIPTVRPYLSLQRGAKDGKCKFYIRVGIENRLKLYPLFPYPQEDLYNLVNETVVGPKTNKQVPVQTKRISKAIGNPNAFELDRIVPEQVTELRNQIDYFIQCGIGITHELIARTWA